MGTADQTQVLHNELWLQAGKLCPGSSAALLDVWYAAGSSALLPLHCTGPLFSSRHLQ